MTVDATYMNLFPSHQLLFTNREIMKPNNDNHYQQQQQQQHILNSGACNNNAQLDSTAMVQPFMPFYQSNVCDPNKADSGITCHSIPFQRKRFRDFTTELTSFEFSPHKRNKLSSPKSSFLEQDVLYQIQNQQQIEIDRVLAHHAEKVRVELEEQKLRQSRMLLATIQEAMAKKLREKDEEIQRLVKMNMTLQERVNSLCVENQIWRELAQTNETTANCLRSNLEQVLAHVGEDCHVAEAVVVVDDAQSSCGSNHEAEDGDDTAGSGAVGGGWNNMCKNCGVKESIVLLLPCRHLCLCTNCGSTIHYCPLCNSGIEASVHVNLSN